MSRTTSTESVLNLGYGLFARIIAQVMPWPLWDVNSPLDDIQKSTSIHREWDTVTKLHICQWENSTGKFKRTSDEVTILVDTMEALQDILACEPQLLEGKTIGSLKIFWIVEVSCIGLYSNNKGRGVALTTSQWRSLAKAVPTLDILPWKPPSLDFFQESENQTDRSQSKGLAPEIWRANIIAQKLMIETCGHLVSRFLKTGKRLSRSNSTSGSSASKDTSGHFSDAFADIKRAIREISDRQQKSAFKAAVGVVTKPEVMYRDSVEVYFEQLKQQFGLESLKYDRQFVSMILSTPCFQEKITDSVLQKALEFWRSNDQA